MNFRRTFLTAIAAAALATGFSAAPALAAQCGNSAGGFNQWKQQMAQEAVRAGISQRTVEAALMPAQYSSKVISLDRNQHSMNLSLDAFMARRAPASFVSKGKRIISQNRQLLNSIEQRYGVQKEVLVAIWGMETGFGSNSGNMNVFNSLATLAYDCRRSDFFTEELLAALGIVDRGDMRPNQMRGAWAGEIGQTQFLAKNYLRFAVDGDGNGRRDLINSKADVLASTANFLRQHGWQPGAGYQPGQPNFSVLRDWNRAGVYQKALALFASKLAS
ncbi:lytic transglycosylase domain-containing protein [Aurantimonas sp. VKM B-3413]|uniref:lytic murein transglycosylase n=1 Tax=Aurantimonas sp. VKM B-3413 TaxID=2779401 RepID=UPI001E4D8EE2|nr:lytic murein transglycosylase [Aurantimonas sp. VKM B-3413]MCB8837053.1 lytic murein transglycosylase [Aurantimonas sp. VKM B-3413]